MLDDAQLHHIKVIWCCIVWLPLMWCSTCVYRAKYVNILLEECLAEFFIGVGSVGIWSLTYYLVASNFLMSIQACSIISDLHQ
jgi:hypothetical protein